MDVAKSVTFFMLVTNRDIYIADYSIRSYTKLENKNVSFKLFIYANCLDTDLKKTYFNKWRKFNYVEIFDNEQLVTDKQLKAGEIIMSPEGIKRIRDSSCENYDEIWSRELNKITTPYHATVDADFEILHPAFVIEMLRLLDAEPNLVAMSSDYTPHLENHFDTYSNHYIRLNQRWNTWFCIYKQKVAVSKVSHFYYEEPSTNGQKKVYDSAGYFQKNLIEEFGFTIKVIDSKYQNQFIHYGAFSKNRTLNKKNISTYRKLYIFKKIGLVTTDNQFVNKFINNPVKKIAQKLFLMYYNKVEKERRVYNFSN